MLACMFSAMEQVGASEPGAPEPLNTRLQESFLGTAGWMRNKED